MPTMNAVALLLLLSALIAATGFVGTYASFAPWRSNEVGRSMMLLAVSLILLIVAGIFLNAFGPHYPFRDAFRMTTYVVLNVALWKQLLVLLKVLNKKNKPEPEPEQPVAPLRVLPAPRDPEETEDKLSAV